MLLLSVNDKIQISLVVPILNEEKTLRGLFNSLDSQTRPPDEIIFVDAGSVDNTIKIVRSRKIENGKIKLIQAVKAMPGEGRNIGTKNAKYEWIAYTDAGIILDKNWLYYLEQSALKNKNVAIVYGNYSPIVDTFFEKCAAIAYVAPLYPGQIRGKFIASSLIRKSTFEKVGGFPDWRAAEDLYFMEKADKIANVIEAPDAKVSWELRPDFSSTYRRFELYSTYNVWAGRQALWHHAVLRQYLLMLAFCILGFVHSGWWFLAVPAWILARSLKRIFQHRFEFGWGVLFNPLVILYVSLISLVIDAATFTGWIKARMRPNPLRRS